MEPSPSISYPFELRVVVIWGRLKGFPKLCYGVRVDKWDYMCSLVNNKLISNFQKKEKSKFYKKKTKSKKRKDVVYAFMGR